MGIAVGIAGSKGCSCRDTMGFGRAGGSGEGRQRFVPLHICSGHLCLSVVGSAWRGLRDTREQGWEQLSSCQGLLSPSGGGSVGTGETEGLGAQLAMEAMGIAVFDPVQLLVIPIC